MPLHPLASKEEGPVRQRSRVKIARDHRLESSKLEHGIVHLESKRGAHQDRRERAVDVRDSNPACDLVSQRSASFGRFSNDLDACLRDKAKLQRAYGECLGNERR